MNLPTLFLDLHSRSEWNPHSESKDFPEVPFYRGVEKCKFYTLLSPSHSISCLPLNNLIFFFFFWPHHDNQQDILEVPAILHLSGVRERYSQKFPGSTHSGSSPRLFVADSRLVDVASFQGRRSLQTYNSGCPKCVFECIGSVFPRSVHKIPSRRPPSGIWRGGVLATNLMG